MFSIYTQEFQPYYNNDHNITIIYSSGMVPYGFNAYITIVKKEFEMVDGNCSYRANIWSSDPRCFLFSKCLFQ